MLDANGVQFRSLHDPIEIGTPTGNLILQVLGAVAEFERALNQTHTRAGLEAAAARGRRGGRKAALSAEYLETAAELLRNPNRTVEDMAKRQGCSVSTVYRHLPRGGSRMVEVDPVIVRAGETRE